MQLLNHRKDIVEFVCYKVQLFFLDQGYLWLLADKNKMKSELSDGMSNHSDFSNDSQNSQISNVDFLSLGNGILLTPTTVSFIIFLICLLFITVVSSLVWLFFLPWAIQRLKTGLFFEMCYEAYVVFYLHSWFFDIVKIKHLLFKCQNPNLKNLNTVIQFNLIYNRSTVTKVIYCNLKKSVGRYVMFL